MPLTFEDYECDNCSHFIIDEKDCTICGRYESVCEACGYCHYCKNVDI